MYVKLYISTIEYRIRQRSERYSLLLTPLVTLTTIFVYK